MKTNLKNIAGRVNDLTLRAAVWSQVNAVPSASDMQVAGKLGAAGALLLAAGVATAQTSNGIITGVTNATNTAKAIISFIAVVGVLAGLGFMLAAAMDIHKKHNNSRDDISWGMITGKAVAGAVALALTYFGTQLVVTLGGSASDIGKSLAN